MNTKKMSLDNIQGKLSRTEMKNIMAGDDPIGTIGNEPFCGLPCKTTQGCKNVNKGNVCRDCTENGVKNLYCAWA